MFLDHKRAPHPGIFLYMLMLMIAMSKSQHAPHPETGTGEPARISYMYLPTYLDRYL